MITLNTALIKALEIDSFYITPSLDFLILITEKNKYFGQVIKNGSPFCKLVIDCEEESSNFQVDINLFELTAGSTNTYSVRPTGYLVLHSSQGEDKYEVRIGNQDRVSLFDNQKLLGNELIAVTLFTPGTYLAKDIRNETLQCRITVSEPTQETVATISNPATVNITENDMQPHELNIVSGQPIIFDSFAGTRLQINPANKDETIAMMNKWKEFEHKIANAEKSRDSEIA